MTLRYSCGNEVMIGDTVLRIQNPCGFLKSGGEHVVTGFGEYGRTIKVLDSTSDLLSPICFKLIKRKQEPKMVWKEMTLEEVKAVQVGDKIRIDGGENEVTYTYNKISDFGFRTSKDRVSNGHNIINSSDVADMLYKFEHLVEETEMNARLERTKVYDVKLTGEEIAWLQFATARGNTSGTLYKSIRSQFGELKGVPESRSNGAAWDHNYQGSISKWYTELFPVPETEDQRKLRELKEQYESLGKAIDAMEKK